MKYAIFENGGKQYKAVEGMTVLIDQLPVTIGDKISLDAVLLLVDEDKIEVGTPLVSKASVKATIVDHEKGPKVVIFKYRPKKRYRVKTGHRQKYTRVVIDSIEME
jgi:large subunit ribosomal protein L21